MKILVVEDDYDLNQAICYSLKKSGYGVYGVTFMEKGKQIFIENQIDMVLLDVNLPDGEGFSFCQWVKKQREVPVIYLTARDMEEDALAGAGRVLVRASGTEALIRVMVEAKTEESARETAERLVNFIKSLKI